MPSEIFKIVSFFTDFDVSLKRANEIPVHVSKTPWLNAFNAPENGQTLKL